MARTITLIRHAETTSNIGGTWQGQSDSPLTDRGHQQVERLAQRMSGHTASLIVASDLGRTQTTAEPIGPSEPNAQWRELDLGAWDNLRPAEIEERYANVDRSRFGSGDFQPEGGERFSAFIERTRGAFDALADRLDDGDEAIVITHGGVVQTIVGSLLGIPDQSAMLTPSNASVTTIRLLDDRVQVHSYNDDLHLDGDVARPGGTRLRLFRHGKTVGNSEGRWFGQSETPLTEDGRRQAEGLAGAAAPLDMIVSSPLGRARDTAAPVADRQGREVAIDGGFSEFFFGEWEGRTVAEILERDADMFRHIHIEGNDEPRGQSGETFSGVGERMATAAAAVASNGAGVVGVFTHGGATRAYAAHLLGLPFVDRERLPVPRNTAHMELIWTRGELRLSSYNVASHLAD
ncbi:MAG: histidine phosphatase family protein [Actinomycetota bacterium]